MFEGKQSNLMEMIGKTFEESELWSLAQMHEQRLEEAQRKEALEAQKKWSPPPRGWVKCNIGVGWSNRNQVGGEAWVIRDHKGKVLLHSKRVFYLIKNLHEAKLKALVWAIESIADHHFDRVIIAIDDGDLSQMILRPKAWPNFKGKIGLIMEGLVRIEWWRLVKEFRDNNRGVFLIAQSVVKGGCLSSYVATGGPRWLHEFFESEKKLSSG